jgi:gliding motility-associated-like protein
VWTPFIPGNAGQITNLPPNGTYSILVGEVANDVCYDTVRVTINNINPDLTVTFTTTDATCNSNDGSITVNPPVAPNIGGGGPYQYAITNGVTTTPFQDDVVFDDIAGGTYSILVRDGTSCVKTITGVNVSFPGFVNFTVTPTAADCSNNGSSGNLTVRFLAAGTYEAGISTDPLVEPATYVSYTTFDPANDVPLVFGNLSRGTYYIFAKTGAALCPTRQGPFTVEGVYALSFDITPICEDNEVSIALTNLTGEPGLPFEILIFRKFTATPLETIPVSQIPVTGSYRLAYDDYDFLRTTDEYQIQIQQVQSGVFCLLSSSLEDYRVQERLYAEVGAVAKSYPDILNGKMQVVNFNGGTIPYDIRIELDSAAVGGQFYQTDWEEVLRNSNLQYQKTYERIPAGRYNVQVMDSVGCVIELVGRVPLDTDIYVPNIFTPNEDGYNDIFFIRNLPVADAKLTVTNRWGKQVYSSGSYQNNWDANGIVDGIYFYRLKVSDGDPITGWVEILRGTKP